MIKRNSFTIVSLGCAKNTVDSESISTICQLAGYTLVEDPDIAQFVIVNTCGFIQDARDESLQVLKQFAKEKKKSQFLIAAGCLSERVKSHLAQDIKNVDAVYGTRRWMDILSVIESLKARENAKQPVIYFPDSQVDEEQYRHIPRVAMQGGSAYLKIADGCRHGCGFCAIPLIKGTKRSRSIESILSDARLLQSQGIKEINLIAQDTTDYGGDLGMKDGLSLLLEKLVKEVPQVPWLRILYAFPGNVTPRLIEWIGNHPQVLPYLDIPLQHAHPEILKKMLRPANEKWVYDTISKLRECNPDIALRTTFIVGFPSESDKEFEYLLDFIKAIEFDHVGAFTYSLEKDTPAEPLGDPVAHEIKLERLERLMLLQEEISSRKNVKMVNKTLPVLIEGVGEDISVGRSYRDAPEIDGLVFVNSELQSGEIYQVRITGGMTHDLLATTI